MMERSFLNPFTSKFTFEDVGLGGGAATVDLFV